VPGPAVVTHVVTDDDTAIALGSGTVAVLATPRIVAWCEDASCQAIGADLEAGQTTVGTEVQLKHVAAVAVGREVRAEAMLDKREGRRLIFNVSVSDGSGLVAAGKVTRVIVDEKSFLEKAR
jgi:predicted thioesterase